MISEEEAAVADDDEEDVEIFIRDEEDAGERATVEDWPPAVDDASTS